MKNSYYRSLQIKQKYKLLCKTWPGQRNPCYFLRTPKRRTLLAVDYLLRNIIIRLWKNGIVTYGSDQGSAFNDGYITFKHDTNALNTIVKLFGIDNVATFSPNEVKHENNMIYFEIIPNGGGRPFMSIYFNHLSIPWIHEKLNIRIPTYPGENPKISKDVCDRFYSAKFDESKYFDKFD